MAMYAVYTQIASLDKNNGNQRHAQGVEPAQKALQGSLVNIAGQDGNQRTSTLAVDRDHHPPGPIRPTLCETERF